MSKIIKPADAAFSMESSGSAVTTTIEHDAAEVRQGLGTAAAGFENTQAKVKDNMEKAIRTAEEMVSFGQGNVEAVVKSGQILAAGMQDLSQQFAANAQAALNETFSTFKALTGIRSFKDAFELQSGLARTAMEKTMAETGRMTEASFRLAEQSFAPIAARVSLTVEKFAKV